MEHFECAVHDGVVGWGNVAQSTHYFVVKLLTVEFIQALNLTIRYLKIVLSC
jgi:hypothetical protein